MRAVPLLAALALLAGAAPARAATAPAKGWGRVAGGPAGGSVWVGRIPNRFVPGDRRPSAVYLPPRYSPARRYPVVYLLHGMRGSPSSIWDGLRLATVADRLISSHRTTPFVAVMPVAGPTVHPDSGEWAGAWESYLVRDVVPWIDAHLSTRATPSGRALEGLCAGGFGAVDIGLRHPGVFGTLGSWEGYFAPVFRDGPFRTATRAALLAHNPTVLVRHDAGALRRSGVRFVVVYGGDHGAIRASWSAAFARELRALRLPYVSFTVSAKPNRGYWRAMVPPALDNAFARTFKPG